MVAGAAGYNPVMRIAVLGTGSFGSHFGAGLIAAGYDVVHGARNLQSDSVLGLLERRPGTRVVPLTEAIQAGDVIIVENGCVHQHFNASDEEDLISLVMKAKPLFLFMHMLFQKVAEYPPKEPIPGWEHWTPPTDL